MTKQDIIDWVKNEFGDIYLATPEATIGQQFENAVRYFNTHSAFMHVRMFDAPGQGHAIQLSKEFKAVQEVFPNRTTTWIFASHPLWSLLGIALVDNLTPDLMLLAEAYRNYRDYLGVKMTWKFIQSNDPENGGWLYVRNLPQGATQVCVLGTKRIYVDEDIKSEHILQFILTYTKALTKITEGNALRKSGIIGVKNDGQEIVNEGFKEKEEVENRLATEARWVTFIRRTL